MIIRVQSLSLFSLQDRKLPSVCKNRSDQEPQKKTYSWQTAAGNEPDGDVTSGSQCTDGHLFSSLQHPFVSQPLSRTVAIELLDGISNLDQVSYQEHLDDDEADAEVWGMGYRLNVVRTERVPAGHQLHQVNQEYLRTGSFAVRMESPPHEVMKRQTTTAIMFHHIL